MTTERTTTDDPTQVPGGIAMVDRAMSGWGHAEDRSNIVVIACDTKHRDAVWQNAIGREEMTHPWEWPGEPVGEAARPINSYNKPPLYSVYHPTDGDAWVTPGKWVAPAAQDDPWHTNEVTMWIANDERAYSAVWDAIERGDNSAVETAQRMAFDLLPEDSGVILNVVDWDAVIATIAD